MGYLLWFLFELITGGAALAAYLYDKPTWMIVVPLVFFIIGLIPILGDGAVDLFT